MPIRGALDNETIRAIRAAFVAGEPIKAIAIDNDVSTATVSKYVRHLPQESKVREARRVAILAALDEGLYARAVATKVGCPVATVVGILRSQWAGT